MLATIPNTKGTREKVKNEVEGFIILRVLRVSNDSEWEDPSFAQPKPKYNKVCFISDFGYLNKKLKRKLYYSPKTNDMSLKLEGFHYAMSLDLIKGYYHIWLSKNTSNLCMIILLWGKYHYKRLPMVVSNPSDIFQQKMNYWFIGL